MFSKIFSTGRETLVKLIASCKRFPEPLSAAVAMVVLLICLSHFDLKDAIQNNLVKMAMVLALGIPVFLIVRLLFERVPNLKLGLKTVIYLCALGGLILYYCYGIEDFRMVSMTRYCAITIAAHLTWIFIPYFYKRENFELYCVRLLTNLTITYFYASVLYIGLAATVFTINSLFGAALGEKIYLDLWLIVAGIFAPAYFLAEIPSIQVEFQVERYPKVLKILFLYIIIPLIIIYAAILYAYFAKIIIIGRWPKGIVSHLVLWYGLVCSSVFFFLNPLRTAVKWLDKLLRLFPIILLPLLAMMFVAMGIRIQAYGITENRYFVLVAGVWLTGWILYQLLKPKTNNLLLPLSLAIIAILTVSGPWSAYSVSKADQYHRFVTILKKYNMIQANRIVKPKRPISTQEQVKIVSILRYFKANHSFRDLKLLPANFKLSQTSQVFGFKIDDDTYMDRYGKSYFNYNIKNSQISNRLYDIGEFDYFINNLQDDTVQTDASKGLTVEYNSRMRELQIKRRDQEIYRQKVLDLIKPLFEDKTPAPTKAITYVAENEQVKVFYVFNSISVRKDQTTEEMEFWGLDFNLFIKLKAKVD